MGRVYEHINEYKQRQNLKEYYRVWFAYLLRTPEFIEYIKQIYHSHVLLADLEPEIKIIRGYDMNWIYPLLPDLYNRFPNIDDFERLWSRWNRFPHFKENATVVNTHVIPELANDIEELLPHFLNEMMSGEINMQEVVDWVSFKIKNFECEGDLVLRIRNPKYCLKKNIEMQINDILSDFPSPIAPLPGEICLEDPVRFNSPSWALFGEIKPGNLNSMKKYLTWYVLSNKNGCCYSLEEIFKQPGVLGIELPFGGGGEGFNFTNHKYEIDLTDRKNRNFIHFGLLEDDRQNKYKHRRVQVAAQRKKKSDIADFKKWANEQSAAAEKIINSVKIGWFPREPKSC